MKPLTVVASVLLLPTFIVGLYGQNFKHIAETGWGQGYAWSWGLIVVTTAL
jgi:magnesium transporter